jgi:hypothetical protein
MKRLILTAMLAASLPPLTLPMIAEAKAKPAKVAPVSVKAPVAKGPPKSLIETYRIAPGQQKAFLEFIDRCDEVNRRAGLSERQLYVHSDGAEFDYILIQPAETPEGKSEALDKAWDDLAMPSGPDFFFEIRKYIDTHTDTFAKGPTTAADYLNGTTPTAPPVYWKSGDVTKTLIEIYRIAPGQQKAFLQFIAKTDEVNRKVGVPPRQLFVHADGADWDFLLIQPAELPPEQQAALDKAWDESGLPSGAAFFFAIRQMIASHSDSFTKGPTTARDFLASDKK